MHIIPLTPNRVWRTYAGGKNLDILAGKEYPSDTHFPEDWIASLTPAVNPDREHLVDEGLSYVTVNGAPVLLKDLIEDNPEEMLGKEHIKKFGLSLSFLIKFLDSATRLHLQCHPTIGFAKRFLNSDYGKTEGYYILDTRKDVEVPFIFLGFQNPPSRERLKEAIEKQDIQFLESCFEKIPVKRGDAFIVPGGLLHAIGEGVFMVEIMEPTDLVVRLEFENSGYVLPEKARFMNRGIDFAISMINFESLSIDTIQSEYFIKERLVNDFGTSKELAIFDKTVTGCFRMNKLVVEGELRLEKESFYIMIITGGSGEIRSGKETFQVKYGDKFFVPASAGMIQYNTDTSLEVILAMPPE